MRTAFVADVPRKTASWDVNAPLTVVISAGSASLRARIETLARRSGALVATASERYDVLLVSLDASTPLQSSLEPLSLLTTSAAKVCVMSEKNPPRGMISRLLRARVAGVVPIDISAARLQSALRAIHAGLQVIDPAVTREDSESRAVATSSPEELTEREQEVLAMLAEGLSNKEISSRLAISTHTVKFHISSILGKLGATSRTEAVSIGIRSGRVAI